jgi:hypothetical protein
LSQVYQLCRAHTDRGETTSNLWQVEPRGQPDLTPVGLFLVYRSREWPARGGRFCGAVARAEAGRSGACLACELRPYAAGGRIR